MTTPARILMTEGDTTPSPPTAGQVLFYAKTDGAFYSLNSLGDETVIGGGNVGTGTVTSVGVTPANGVSGAVANPTTTPEISITLGNITPTSVTTTGNVIAANVSGTNTGDQTITLSGDVTGGGTGAIVTNLANSGVVAGTYTSANITVDAKGRILSATDGSGGGGGGTGTVTSIGVTGANGIIVGGSPSPITLNGTFDLSLGAITPTSVAATGTVTGSNLTGSHTGTSTGTNTGDQVIVLTGDATNSSGSTGGVLTLSTVNSSPGTFGSSISVPVVTVNGKGLVTSITTAAISAGSGTVTTVTSSAGTTGLTNTITTPTTTPNLTISGTLNAASGGTGANTLTGYVKGNGTAAFTAAATVPGADVNGNITGNAANVTGTVAIANGGTGQTTAPLAINALLPTQTGNSGRYLTTNGTVTSWSASAPGTGTVTTVSVTPANGVSGTVATATTTPAITLTLGAITPSSIAATGNISTTGTVTGSNLSGTNSGDQVIALTGDATNSNTSTGGILTLANTTVVPATYGSATQVPVFAVDSKGRITGVTNTAITAGGTVTTVSVVNANGVSGTVATASTTPAITLTLGAITPTSVAATGTITASNFSGSSSGTNTGDQTITLTGDVTGSGTGSFSATLSNTTVVANTYGSATQVPVFSVDAKGRITGVTNTTIAGGTGTITAAANAGAGTGLYTTTTGGNTLNFRSITAGTNVTLAVLGDGSLEINSAGGGGGGTPGAGLTFLPAGELGVDVDPNSAIKLTTPIDTNSKLTLLLDNETDPIDQSGLTQTAAGLRIKPAGVSNDMLAYPMIGLIGNAGNESEVLLGGYLSIYGNGAQGVSTFVNIGSRFDITVQNASTTGGKGVSTYTASEFSVTNGTVSLGNVPIAKGGTGATTAQGARTAILPAQTGNAGMFLTTNGTDVSWSAVGGGGAVTQITAGTGVTVSPVGGTGNVTVANDGVVDIADGTGISHTEGAGGVYTLFNEGVLSIVAGTGITITSDGSPAGTGNVTINSTGGGGGGSAPEQVVFRYTPGAAGTFNDPGNIIVSQTAGVTATITDGANCIVSFVFTGKTNPPKSVTSYGQVFSSNKFRVTAPYTQTTSLMDGGGTNLNPDLGNLLFTTANVLSLQLRPADTGSAGAVGQRAWLVVVFGF